MNIDEGLRKIEEMFGSRLVFLGHQILTLSTSGQPCDITFYEREPAVDVTVDPQLSLALMYGAGPQRLRAMLESIKLSNGSVVSMNDIWTINPMPKGGFSKGELEAVDISQAEEKAGPNGETLRKMIKDTYHCKSQGEEDHYLRRFIAS
jgi:hypothetical protein